MGRRADEDHGGVMGVREQLTRWLMPVNGRSATHSASGLMIMANVVKMTALILNPVWNERL